MINGTNARLIVLMLFATVIALIISISLITISGDDVPIILGNTLTTIIGMIIGAIGLNFQLPKDGGGNSSPTGK